MFVSDESGDIIFAMRSLFIAYVVHWSLGDYNRAIHYCITSDAMEHTMPSARL